MARYELSGEFFWVIELSNKNVSTSLGKVGNAGHTRVKTYGSTTEAMRAYDELVAEKQAQGYELVGEDDAIPPAKPRAAPAAPARARKKPAAKATRRKR